MVEKYNVRTDLALEQKERFEVDNVEISGVIVEEIYDEENLSRTIELSDIKELNVKLNKKIRVFI